MPPVGDDVYKEDSTVNLLEEKAAALLRLSERRQNGEKCLADHIKTQGVLIDRVENLRMVTHLNITKNDIYKTVQAFHSFYDK